jgi:serine/threonine protein kinase
MITVRKIAELQAGDPRWAGPFRLLGLLGTGGMGRVYLGRSVSGRQVAVKVIRPELAADPEFRVRFAREVAAARKVSGLFTASVVDADADGPVPWLATAYVDGPSLADAVAAQGPLPVASVLMLAAGLAEGLAAIHAAGVVHRDLTPSNVLLAEDGPRVIDFGISRAVEASTLTQSGTVMGCPGYMSPEQAEGGAVGPASDVFNLGAVLAFAASGRGPFGTGATPVLIYRAVHHQPDMAEVPEPLRPLILRCLAKDPGDRPTAGNVLAELEPSVTLHPLTAFDLADGGSSSVPDTVDAEQFICMLSVPREPLRRREWLGRWSRRRLAGAAVMAGLIAASVAVAAALSVIPEPRPSPAPPSRPSIISASARMRPPTQGSAKATSSPSGDAASTASVPDVMNMTLSAATSALRVRNYHNVPYLYDCYGSPDIGDVVRQVPGAGAHLALTAPVQLQLQANNCHTVPSVVGMDLSDAAYTLKQDGFSNIPYLYDCYGSPDTGAVVRQSPAAGTSYGSTQPVSLKLQADNC